MKHVLPSKLAKGLIASQWPFIVYNNINAVLYYYFATEIIRLSDPPSTKTNRKNITLYKDIGVSKLIRYVYIRTMK